MSEQQVEYETNYVEKATYNVNQEPIVLSKPTLDLFLRQNNPGDLIALYTFYYYTAKWQRTNQPRCTEKYVMKGLKWGRDKLRKTKKQLKDFGLIEDLAAKDEKTGRVKSHYIAVSFIWTKEKVDQIHTTENPTGGLSHPMDNQPTNALSSNKGNALSSNNRNKDTIVSSAPDQEQLVQPTKSFSPQTEQIINWWNTLLKATKHTRSDTKVYQRSAMYLDRLLNGTPILQIKSGKPTKNLLHFAEKFNLSEDLVQKKFSERQIKDIIQKIHDDNLDSHKKHSLESVLWNSFAGKAGGFSHFLHKAAQLNVPEKYIDLSKKLAEIAEVNLPEHTLLDWAKDLQDYLSENGGSVEQVRNILNWYTYYIENKYTPKARDMEEFIYKLPRIDAAMQRSEDKEQKPSNWYREKKENRTRYSF